jgi:hypothetical protein
MFMAQLRQESSIIKKDFIALAMGSSIFQKEGTVVSVYMLEV